MEAQVIDTLLKNGWSYHTNQTERLATELAALNLNLATSEQITPLLLLSNHAVGEHLGWWRQAKTFAQNLLKDIEADQEQSALLNVCIFMGDISQSSAQTDQLVISDNVLATIENNHLIAKALIANGYVKEGLTRLKQVIKLADETELSNELIKKLAVANNSVANHLLATTNRATEQDDTMLYVTPPNYQTNRMAPHTLLYSSHNPATTTPSIHRSNL